jgi:hypothetical protein
MHRLASREFPGMPLLSRLLYKRFRFEVFRRHRFHSGRKPAYVFYDTGAEIHEHLTARRGFEFRSVAAGAVPWSANHLGGVTRGVLDNSAYRAREFDDAEEFARRKLKEDYGVTISNPSQVE